jgi:hypothetical protein
LTGTPGVDVGKRFTLGSTQETSVVHSFLAWMSTAKPLLYLLAAWLYLWHRDK